MRKPLIKKHEFFGKAASIRRTQGAARMRRLFMEALEPRNLLTVVTIVPLISSASEPNHDWAMEEEIDSGIVGKFKAVRTGSTQGPLYIGWGFDHFDGRAQSNDFHLDSDFVIGNADLVSCPSSAGFSLCFTIPANQTEQEFNIVAEFDGYYEIDETLRLTFFGQPELYSLATNTLDFEIIDRTQSVGIEAGSNASEIGPTNGSFTVRRYDFEGDQAIALGVAYTVSGPATLTVGDHNLGTGGSVTIPANEDEVTLTVVPNPEDCRDEETETLTVTLMEPQPGPGYGQAPASFYKVNTSYPLANISIIDGDLPPLISVSDWQGNESTPSNPTTAAFGFTFQCANDPSKPGLSDYGVNISYSTQNGTALGGEDFVASSGTLSLPDTSMPANVPFIYILDDTLDEPTEQFYVNFPSAEYGTMIDNQAIGTIFDMDPSPTISINNVTVEEINEQDVLATFEVSLSFATTLTVDAQYWTENVSATAPGDYTSVPATPISFAPGQTTKTIEVTVKDDSVAELSETFRIVLGGVQNANLPFTGGGGIGTIVDSDSPLQVPPSCQNCSASNNRDLVNRSAPGVGSSFASPGLTSAPVRYADGTVLVASTDIQADSFGLPWGITRSWTNGSGYAPQNIVGDGMVISEQPFLISIDNDNVIAAVTNSLTARYFYLVNGVYTPAFFLQEKLIRAGSEFVLIDTSGAQIRFYDFSTNHPQSQRGQFKGYKDSSGNDITTVYANGRLAEVLRSHQEGTLTYTDSFLYSYNATGVNAGLISSVIYRRSTNGGSSWSTWQTASYTYYGLNESFGNPGNLKKVTTTYGNSGSDTTYYRYYKPGEANGYTNGLKYVVYPESYRRFPGDPTTASDATLAPYADHYFEYDAEHRAKKEIAQGAGCSTCSAGMGHFTFAYDSPTSSPSWATGTNAWVLRTTETLPDLNQNVVYTNEYGQVMLEVFVESPGTPNAKKWATYYRYDDDGRVLFRADPSAVMSYSESLPDLMGHDPATDTYTHLFNHTGLITDFTYYDEEDTQPGAVNGYLEYVKVRNGDSDATPSEQALYTYVGRTINAQTVYFVASSTVFEEDDGDGELKTEYFYSGSNRIEQVTTKDPTHALTTIVFDTYGRPTSTTDAGGFIHQVTYWEGSNSPKTIITDVGGIHSATSFDPIDTGGFIDKLQRPVKITDPNSNMNRIEYKDGSHETRIYPGINQSPWSPSGPIAVTRLGWGGAYSETLTMSEMPTPTWEGTEYFTGLESLSRTYFNSAGQVIHTDDYFDLDLGPLYNYSPTFGTLNVNFYRTTYAYDQRGRLSKMVRPDGTIYRTVYDGLGRPISEWIGTDDTPTTGTWPTQTDGTNLVRMQFYIYDNGGAGPGNVTGITDALNRTTTFDYDYLGRVTKVTLPDPDLNVAGDIPDYETTYDNLGRVKTQTDPLDQVTSYSYVINTATHETTVTVTLPDPDAGGPLQSPIITSVYDARGLLISQTDPELRKTTYEYDGAGRLVKVTLVNPGNSLETEYQYDDAGNLRFIIDPADNQTERVYDELNRLTDVYAPDPDGPASPQERPRTQYAYDSASRLLSLTDPVGNATSWFYDALGRVTQELNHIGQSRYFEYDAASRLIERTDRLGRVIEFDYNQFDQVTQERWYDSSGLVRTLTHNYDAMGQLLGASDPAATYAYVPDRLGRLKTETQTIAGFSPSFNIQYTSTYNKAGSRESLKTLLGTTADFQNTYVYDHLQRLTSLTQQGQGGSGNTVAPKHIKFAYNAAGQFETIGRYANAAGTELVANTFYKYDPLGRLESMIHSEDATAPTSGWGADPLAGYIYLYDTASRLHEVNSLHVVDATNVFENSVYTYDNTNQLTAADHDAQTDESYTYDANGNRTGPGYQTGPNNRLSSDGTHWYVHDAEGNRTARVRLSDNTYTQYIYDHRNRLVSVGEVNQPFPTLEPTWDSVGPFSVNGEEPHYLQVAVLPAFEGDPLVLMAGLDGVVTEYYIEVVSAVPGVHFTDPFNTSEINWGPVSFSESANGHELEIPTHYLSAYSGNLTLLVHLRFDGTELCVVQGVIYDRQATTIQSVDYDYDLYNRLVHRAFDPDGDIGPDPATHTFFSWENGQIVFQFDNPASAAPSHRYLWNPLATDQILADENSLNEVLWPLTDHLGTARDIAQHDAGETTIVNHRLYDSFGRLMSESDDGFTIAFGFTGVYFDTATSLNYHRNRWYDPAVGRWLSEDPSGFEGDPGNLYRYVRNSPTNFIDPSGLEGEPISDMEIYNINQVYLSIDYLEDSSDWMNVVGFLSLSKGLRPWKQRHEVVDEFVRNENFKLHNKSNTKVCVVPWWVGGPKAVGTIPNAVAKAKDLPVGSFSIWNWLGYPKSIPKPKGPFRILDGDEYQAARKAADEANAALRRANPELYEGKHIHEIQPVKFGGDPIDPANKIPLTPAEHYPVSSWWNGFLRRCKGQ
jgi:RHS repeat-associated protein